MVPGAAGGSSTSAVAAVTGEWRILCGAGETGPDPAFSQTSDAYWEALVPAGWVQA